MKPFAYEEFLRKIFSSEFCFLQGRVANLHHEKKTKEQKEKDEAKSY